MGECPSTHSIGSPSSWMAKTAFIAALLIFLSFVLLRYIHFILICDAFSDLAEGCLRDASQEQAQIHLDEAPASVSWQGHYCTHVTAC